MSNKLLHYTTGVLVLCSVGNADITERKYNYYLDANHAEEILAGIAINPPIPETDWLNMVGSRKTETYTVQKGDTLWKIARKEFGNPRLWRKLWQTNSTLTNPHEISVGQILAYYNAADRNPASEDEPIRIPLIKLLPDGSATDLDRDAFVNTDIKNRFEPSLFVVKNQDLRGRITGGYTMSNAFNEHDDIYIKPYGPSPKVGEKFTVVHFERVLKDRTQVSAPIIGNLVRNLGEMEIVETGGKLVKGRITAMHERVRRGDRIVTLQTPSNFLLSFRPPAKLTTRIVSGTEQGKTLFAQGDLVLLNRGLQDGIKDGFMFRVYRDFDPRSMSKSDVAPASNGDVQVIFTAAQSSVGYVIRSSDLIHEGDLLVPKQTFPDPPPSPHASGASFELDDKKPLPAAH